MSAVTVQKQTESCTIGQITAHLQVCDAQFVPPLGTRVDLLAYAEKLHAHAIRFEAWSDAELVGLVAGYFNQATRVCFITSVSVLPDFQGQGIAVDLISTSLDAASARGMRSIVLEVSSANSAALGLYKKLGFAVDTQRNEIVRMQRHINQHSLA